jgi:hypothetical protein
LDEVSAVVPSGRLPKLIQGNVLAAIDAVASPAARRIEVELGADGWQAFRVAFERKAFFDQLFAQIARHERIVGVIGGAWHLIGKADILVAAGEQPEIVALAVVLLGEHASNACALRCQASDIRRAGIISEDLLHIFVFFDDDDDVIVDRQFRRPRDPVRSHRHAWRTDQQSKGVCAHSHFACMERIATINLGGLSPDCA